MTTSQWTGSATRWGRYLGMVGAVTLLACGATQPEPQPEPQPVTPIAHSQMLEMFEGTSLPITLEGEVGPEASATFTIEEAPRFGQLEGTPPNLTYVPDEGYLGLDVFSFSVSDGERGSSASVVAVDVLNTPFYAITRGSESRQSILQRVGTRGEVTEIGPTGHALITLKFDPTDGTLYAITRGDDFEAACDNCLVTLDLETGAATVVAPLTLGDESHGPVPSIAFLSDGSLYGFSEQGDDMVKIDKATGAVEVFEDSGIDSWGHGMWTTPDDTLWFLNGDGAVYTLDPATGIPTLIHGYEVLTESFGDGRSEVQVRGDRNPNTGRYWGVVDNAGTIAQTEIDGEQARSIRGSPIFVGELTHNLAFPPSAP